jgi:hypothetical protein
MWTIIVFAQLISLPVLFIWQYLSLSRRFYFDQSLYTLRQLKHEAVLYLSEQVMNEEYDRDQVIELRKMTATLDLSINKVELLKTNLFNYKSFKRVKQVSTVAKNATIELMRKLKANASSMVTCPPPATHAQTDQ